MHLLKAELQPPPAVCQGILNSSVWRCLWASQDIGDVTRHAHPLISGHWWEEKGVSVNWHVIVNVCRSPAELGFTVQLRLYWRKKRKVKVWFISRVSLWIHGQSSRGSLHYVVRKVVCYCVSTTHICFLDPGIFFFFFYIALRSEIICRMILRFFYRQKMRWRRRKEKRRSGMCTGLNWVFTGSNASQPLTYTWAPEPCGQPRCKIAENQFVHCFTPFFFLK